MTRLSKVTPQADLISPPRSMPEGLIEAGVDVIDARRALNADLMRLKSLIGAAPFNGDFPMKQTHILPTTMMVLAVILGGMRQCNPGYKSGR